MAFQRETGSGSARPTDRKEWVNGRVLFMCSQHVATVAINNGGTGGTYVVGDIVTLTHASAHFDARFEVTGVSAGQITTLEIRDSGAFAQQAASAVVGAATGSGYAVGDILEVQGGSSRCPAKFEVATLSGSSVATVTLFEGGGVYSSTPANDAATVGVGPSGFAGDDAATLTVTYQAIVGTTNVAVTGGGGTGATVDITLAETGWAVDERNTNSMVINGEDDEKQVVLKGDASGLSNKPFAAFATATEDDGLDVIEIVINMALIAHNPAIDLTAHTPRSRGLTSETVVETTGAFNRMLNDSSPPGNAGEVDVWMAADDTHFREISQIDMDAAVSDNGFYQHCYVGYLDRIGTETENPYPMYVFGSIRDPSSDPAVSSVNNTGLAEQRNGPSGASNADACSFVYEPESAAFEEYRNAQGTGSAIGEEERMIAPVANFDHNDSGGGGDRDDLITQRPDATMVRFWGDNGDGAIFDLEDRTTRSRTLRWVPGTVDLPFLWPLTPARKALNDPALTDRLHGNIKGCYWISSDNGSGQRITNFSEDYVTISGVRYYVFHHGANTDVTQYIAFEENV